MSEILPGYDAWKLRSRDDDLDRYDELELDRLAKEERADLEADLDAYYNPEPDPEPFDEGGQP